MDEIERSTLDIGESLICPFRAGYLSNAKNWLRVFVCQKGYEKVSDYELMTTVEFTSQAAGKRLFERLAT